MWVSSTFTQLTGCTSSDAVGRDLLFWTGPDTDPHALARLRGDLVRTSRGAVPAEAPAADAIRETLLAHRRDGSAFYNHLTVLPVLDDDGGTAHRISLQSDVTAHVLAGTSAPGNGETPTSAWTQPARRRPPPRTPTAQGVCC